MRSYACPWDVLASIIELMPIFQDLRNHGDSPHSEGTTYRHLASDVSEFLSTNKLKQPILMGHSL